MKTSRKNGKRSGNQEMRPRDKNLIKENIAQTTNNPMAREFGNKNSKK